MTLIISNFWIAILVAIAGLYWMMCSYPSFVKGLIKIRTTLKYPEPDNFAIRPLCAILITMFMILWVTMCAYYIIEITEGNPWVIL